jgi:hypothetical protein
VLARVDQIGLKATLLTIKYKMPQYCIDFECNKRAIFNLPGLRKPLYCAKHATDAMINVTKRPCHHTGCRTQPNFNLPGSKKGLYCAKHAKTEMVNVVSPTCNHHGCKTKPNFNLPGSKKGLYCAKHVTNEMVNVIDPTCNHHGCKTRPYFNLPGKKSGIFCAKHATDAMIDVIHQTCNHHGCKTRPYFNLPGKKSGIFCAKHATDAMIDVIHQTCNHTGCNTQPVFNLPGLKKGLYCCKHATDAMIDVINPKCKSCGLFRAKKHNDYLCSYCNPVKSTRYKTKENRVRDLLTEHNIQFTQDKTFENECCLKYRPDFLIECGSYFIVLEVDEYGHEQYDKHCEIVRMNNISSAIGLPVKWLRYNPDSKVLSKKEREAGLLKTIKYNIGHDFMEDLSVVYI